MTMKIMPIVINLIQDLATPHNNVLIEQFVNRSDVQLKLWYASAQDIGRYQWVKDITHQHLTAEIYGTGLNLKFLYYCIRHRNEKFVIVGWMNINTFLLHILFFFFRRPFNHWTDRPHTMRKSNFRRAILRWLANFLLRYSHCRVFCVGKTTIDYFRNLDFPETMLVNLPIFVSVDDNLSDFTLHKSEIFLRYEVPQEGFLISAGSRLIFEKGYDLMIQAIAELPLELRSRAKVVIVGSGNEANNLKNLISKLGLEHTVYIENWLEIEDFKLLIANSDIFVHPARFDSYGGTIFAMALGVPVIGSDGAGAVVDRIRHKENGFIYSALDYRALSRLIVNLALEPTLRRVIGEGARQTALEWKPERGVEILIRNAI